mmetsp:Transcript_35608/g.87219  ORF Transcript_35608/g.87219 Transcript_35608/m.87219 type:complete len:92 (+) Transcript_35608:3-278(+)
MVRASAVFSGSEDQSPVRRHTESEEAASAGGQEAQVSHVDEVALAVANTIQEVAGGQFDEKNRMTRDRLQRHVQRARTRHLTGLDAGYVSD